MKDPRQLDLIVNEYFAIEAETAKEAGTLAYLTRVMAQTSMPHTDPKESSFERRAGKLWFSMTSPKHIGVPFGIVPRRCMVYITTYAKQHHTPMVLFGDHLSEGMRNLGMAVTGGERGTIGMLRRQLRRLLSCSIQWDWEDSREEKSGWQIAGTRIADEACLWWDTKTKQLDQDELFPSYVLLATPFFNEITHFSVPLDQRVLIALRRDTLAFDIYVWLTYRMFALKRPYPIRWEALSAQFGSDYALLRQFKAKFLAALKKVNLLYKPRVELTENGLMLYPSPTSVSKVYLSTQKR